MDRRVKPADDSRDGQAKQRQGHLTRHNKNGRKAAGIA
jgi:hypothetical protein